MSQLIFSNNQKHYSSESAHSQPTDALKVHVDKMGKITLPVTDLMFLQAAGSYCWMYWEDGQRILVAHTLKYYEPHLSDTWFVRPHRNCIVNLQYIERMVPVYPDKGGLLHLRSGVVLPVSRRRWFAIKKLYKQLSS